MLAYILIPIVLLATIALIAASLLATMLRHPKVLPPNAPDAWIKKHGLPQDQPPRHQPIIVCAGDSITHGILSANYVDMLAQRIPDAVFINAGINSELAYNLYARIDPIIAINPDFVTILIGSNDANATFGISSTMSYLAIQKLPQVPTPQFYREMLTLIIRRLKAETAARIAVASIPPIGEDPHHYAWVRAEEYGIIAKETAFAEAVDYLPLRERMCDYLSEAPKKKPVPFEGIRKAARGALWDHMIMGQDWDEIAARNGFHLLVDGLHLNSHGASMMAGLVERFIQAGRRAAPAQEPVTTAVPRS
jgi:lysophospholipase L1-like esterase